MPAIILAMLSEALLDHFRNPRNAGELPEATARIEVSNPVCGDVLRLAAVFEDGVVREVRFLCRGCTASIACASLLTESMRGRESHGLRKITAESLSETLGGLPEASFHAAQLARHALEALLEAVGR
jgi:nitrogen fixation NifU-like protein